MEMQTKQKNVLPSQRLVKFTSMVHIGVKSKKNNKCYLLQKLT